MTNEVRCWCQHCGKELEPSHTGKCPYCGKTGKRCEATVSLALGLKVSASATRTRVYFEWFNREVKGTVGTIVINATIALVSTLVGSFAGNAWIGFAISLVIIIISNVFFKRRVKRKIREITQVK